MYKGTPIPCPGNWLNFFLGRKECWSALPLPPPPLNNFIKTGAASQSASNCKTNENEKILRTSLDAGQYEKEWYRVVGQLPTGSHYSPTIAHQDHDS